MLPVIPQPLLSTATTPSDATLLTRSAQRLACFEPKTRHSSPDDACLQQVGVEIVLSARNYYASSRTRGVYRVSSFVAKSLILRWKHMLAAEDLPRWTTWLQSLPWRSRHPAINGRATASRVSRPSRGAGARRPCQTTPHARSLPHAMRGSHTDLESRAVLSVPGLVQIMDGCFRR